MKRLNILMCFLVLTGCASIIRDNTQIVPIQANVENAKIEVTNSSGAVVYSGQTPTTVYLKSSKSGYFNPEKYIIKALIMSLVLLSPIESKLFMLYAMF